MAVTQNKGENSGVCGGADKTSCDIGPYEFFQVKVPYALCTDIAQLIGVHTKEVLQIVEEDNVDRARQPCGQDLH